MKRRLLLLLAAGALLLMLVAACGGRTSSRGWAPPVTTDNLLLVSTGRGQLDGLDVASGRRQWRFPDDWSIANNRGGVQGIYGPPVVSADGRVVFVGDYSSRVYAFRPADSSLLASNQRPDATFVDLDGKVVGGVALDAASGNLVVSAGDSLYKVRASDLVERIDNKDKNVAVERLFSAGGEIWGTPLISQGRVYASSLDGNLYAIDLATGSLVWQPFETSRPLVSSPVLSGGVILAGGFDKRLHAVDASGGTEKWSFRAADWVWSRPAVDGGRVYFGDFDGRVYALDLASGSLAWDLGLGHGPIRGGPVVARGTLVVGTEDGWLVGIDIASHTRLWERDLGSGIHADLLLSGENVFIAPRGCVTSPGTTDRVYYTTVDPASGQLAAAEGVC